MLSQRCRVRLGPPAITDQYTDAYVEGNEQGTPKPEDFNLTRSNRIGATLWT